jgi:hypothetical protein
MIATVASALTPQQTLWSRLSESFLPFSVPRLLIPWVNLLFIVVVVYVGYRLATNKRFVKKVTGILRTKIIRRAIFRPVSFEELLMLAGGYGVSKIDVSPDNPLVGKTLTQSDLRKSDIMVLAIVRAEETIPNPPANTQILSGDELISFGKLENIRNKCVPKKERANK